jgi:hypothetical protein
MMHMSRQLAFSSTISVMVMAAFALSTSTVATASLVRAPAPVVASGR